jgi:L-threonylcarbamoyladenylate synthase
MPLLLLVSGLEMARAFAADASSDLERLAEVFWPGPLTVVVPAPSGLAPEVTAGGTTVALRHPAHPVAEAVVRALGHPITGTSANRSGHPPVRDAGQISLAPGLRLDGLIDAGPTPGGAVSTLLDLTSPVPRVLRAGAVSAPQLAEILGTGLL